MTSDAFCKSESSSGATDGSSAKPYGVVQTVSRRDVSQVEQTVEVVQALTVCQFAALVAHLEFGRHAQAELALLDVALPSRRKVVEGRSVLLDQARVGRKEGRVVKAVEEDEKVVRLSVTRAGSAVAPTTEEHADLTHTSETNQGTSLG